ncbi:MAG: beta-lactamase family protein [Natronospirillum sp.]|uniref:serine hydrolase domain-containing protein n=1 Tax=Natronospirillum sp. TaxID=2812955 RepID=UPI0025F93FBC|nr:serine hydrolase domain-containing protein [Natronospirillum sp.]MCH8553456.1 beta-lactamase family protein [Natronospirillum sp.]
MTQSLDALLDQLIERKDIHSAIMSVASGDGTFKWSGARGVMSPDGPPVTPTTPWFVASITKLFIASVVMRLVEQGELALEDRLVDRHSPDITHGLHVLDGKDRTGQITIAHLLGHASGLPDYIEDYPKKQRKDLADRRSLVEILVEDGDRDWSLEDTAQWVRERLTPHFVPQALDGKRVRIRYSDTNYQLLVGIVETCRKAPFPRILQDLILDPLALKNTWFSGHYQGAGPEPAVPVLYAGADPINIPRFLTSIGDMNATCDDLISFFRAVVQGRLFEQDDTWRRMQSPAHRFSFPTDRGALRQPGWPIEYGLGVMGFQLPRLFTPFKPMPKVVGHTGSTGTWLFYAPEPDLYLAGAVSQVTAGAVPFKVVPKILQSVGQRPRT